MRKMRLEMKSERLGFYGVSLVAMAGEGGGVFWLRRLLCTLLSGWCSGWWLAREQARANARGSDKLTRVRSTEVINKTFWGLRGWSRGGKRCTPHCTSLVRIFMHYLLLYFCTFVLLWFESIRAQATTGALLDTFHITVVRSPWFAVRSSQQELFRGAQPILLLRLKGWRSLFLISQERRGKSGSFNRCLGTLLHPLLSHTHLRATPNVATRTSVSFNTFSLLSIW